MTVTPQVAAGTSLLVIIFTGLSSTIAYYKQKKVDYKVGCLLFIGSGPAGIWGAWVNKELNVDAFSLWFGFFMIFISFVLMVKDKINPIKRNNMKGIWRTYNDSFGNEQTYGFNPITGFLISIIVGFLGRSSWNWRWVVNGTLIDLVIPFPSTYCRGHLHVFTIFNIINKFCRPYYDGKCQLAICHCTDILVHGLVGN